jgi:Raf kinase inhibitor-like YbhB/YbcL family protein
MELSSSTFAPRADTSRRHTCAGEDIALSSPWRRVPEGAASLMRVVDDLDAPVPAAPRMTWVRWVLCGMPASAPGLPELGRALPADTCEGLDDRGREGCGGPCPALGPHRDDFKVYAIDKVLPVLPRPTEANVEEAMCGHVLARAESIGTDRKRRP